MCSNHIAATTRRGGNGRPFGTPRFRPPWAYGPLVKRLRHRPFTAVTRVRVPYGSPIWRLSSAGRALASHARGHRFEFCSLHHSRANPCDLHGFSSFSALFQAVYFCRFPLTQTVTHTGAWSGTDRTENRDDRRPAIEKYSVYLRGFGDLGLTICKH